MTAARFAGLPEIAAGRVGDARFELACLTAVYALVCWLALLPGWLSGGHGVILGMAVLASVVTAVLFRIRGISQWAAHTVLGCAPLVVAALTISAGGGVDSAAFAYLNVFVTAYAAVFLARRSFAVHLIWSLVASGSALTVTDVGNRENGYFVCVLAITMVTAGVLLARLVREVWSAATHDPLTGLLNEPGLRAAMLSSPAVGQLIVCDIDRFALVNDALGRENGDRLLQAVARGLTSLWPAAMLARLTADVFAVWLPLTGPGHGDVTAVIQTLDTMQGAYPVGGIDIDVTFTAGTATADGSAPTVLLRRANTALTAAKGDARPWYEWTTGMDGEHGTDLQLHAELRRALQQQELVVHYQPQVGRGHHWIIGVEALIRWQHPTRGLLGPGAFLPAAERSPLIEDITDYVLSETGRQGAVWAAAGTPIPISVNLSARSLTDDTLAERIAAHLTISGLPAHLLTVEITETALVTRPEQASRLLRAIRGSGARVSIDDFGTGHTSLALLTDLPIDEIKLDRRFVAAATSQPSAAAVVQTVADLARRLGMHTVAEGVEDHATSAFLDAAGFDSQQGFWHARPEPSHAISRRLAEQNKEAVVPTHSRPPMAT